MALNVAGTNGTPSAILCVDDTTGEPPAAGSLRNTAVVTISGNAAMTFQGWCFVHGIKFTSGGTIVFGAGSGYFFHMRDCEFILTNTGSAGQIVQTETNSRTLVIMENCRFRCGAAANLWYAGGGVHIRGGNAISGGTSPTNWMTLGGANGRGGSPIIEGFDFSNWASALVVFAANTGPGTGIARIMDCKMPASWTGTPCGGLNNPSARCELTNCDDADTRWNFWSVGFAGEHREETTLVRTAGATVAGQALSYKITSSSFAEYPLLPWDTPLPAVWVPAGSRTLTIELLHDSATNLQNDDVWATLRHQGASGFPLGAFVTSRCELLATAADLTASSEAWTTTGMSNPNKQKITLSFTQAEDGYVFPVLYTALASKVLYACPDCVVT